MWTTSACCGAFVAKRTNTVVLHRIASDELTATHAINEVVSRKLELRRAWI
jgi:hypothetical protein